MYLTHEKRLWLKWIPKLEVERGQHIITEGAEKKKKQYRKEMNNSHVREGFCQCENPWRVFEQNNYCHPYLLQEATRLLVEAVSRTNSVNKLGQNIISSKMWLFQQTQFAILIIECLGMFNLPLDLMQNTHCDRQ